MCLFGSAFTSIGQDKELRRAFEEYQSGKIAESIATITKYSDGENQIKMDDAPLFYWVFANDYAAAGVNQNLSWAYRFGESFERAIVELKNADGKGYQKMVEKFGCSIEKGQEFMSSIDDQMAQGCISRRNEQELTEFISKYPRSRHLYEVSDLIDELRVRQVILNRDETAIDRFTKIENYNTLPIDLSRKAVIFNKNIEELNYVLQEILEEKAVNSRSSVDIKKLKAKFPDSKVVLKIEKQLAEQVISNVQGLLNLNKVDVIRFENKPKGESADNVTRDIQPEEFNVAAYDGVKLVAITQVVSESTKYTVKKFYFNQNQEVVAIEASVKPLFYELPVNATPVNEENSKIYFYEGEVVFLEGSLLAKGDLVKGNELKKRADLNRNSEVEKRPDITQIMFNPYSWNSKPTHTIFFNQDGYSVSIAVACVNLDPEMSVEGEAVVTIKKGSLEEKFRIYAAFPFLQKQFMSGIYRLAESEIVDFPFLQFRDCNFDGMIDLGINETAGSYDAGITWYTWNNLSSSFVLDYQMIGLYFGGEVGFNTEEKSLSVSIYTVGSNETTYLLDNGLWRDIYEDSVYTEYEDSTGNSYGVFYNRNIKSGQVIIKNSRELLEE